MISVRFQGKPLNITVIQVYALTSNAEEAEVEWFQEELQDLLELTSKKYVLLSQEIPEVTRPTVLLRECTGHSKHPLPTTQEKTVHMDITRWSKPESD